MTKFKIVSLYGEDAAPARGRERTHWFELGEIVEAINDREAAHFRNGRLFGARRIGGNELVQCLHPYEVEEVVE